MSALRVINFGLIGCGLMGREFASAAARWAHLSNTRTGETLDFAPRLVAVCDLEPRLMSWFTDNFSSVKIASTDYHTLLESQEIEAIYCAVPHNLHAQIYTDIIRAEKHLLGEKPFGIDKPANDHINAVIADHPGVLVRCSSEFPFYPGAYRIAGWTREQRFGQIIEVEAGFWHSSDLDPQKPINWKRMVEINGEYGSLGDLGMHVVHLPFRAGWIPKNVRALLSNVVTRRPGPKGELVPCETWDNAILACEVETEDQNFPLFLSTKRIAPGETNTWFIRVLGMDFSASYSTKTPKTLSSLPYSAGGVQAWHVEELGYTSAYPAITGSIFEFGFPDAFLQMWAAFCDELVNGRDSMAQPFYCVTPEEAMWSHNLFTAALASQKYEQTIRVAEKLEL
jgi:predicted dehydrogenase